ncbi:MULTISPECIES: response regulator [Microtetraspora]|uniref:Response regulator transcription factor n=1 Tax=Microtetraspora glauca TaxID=1996 RepID=A0ABV3GNF7_MICGL|nr:response regulator transcription factor [Microtetraspora sp. AC03309]MCC5579776.1 response regulator transcription factor [Microtetraspora sp. AC03309]
MTIRVMVVDDHPLFRDGLRAMLSTVAGLDVVAVAEDGAKALTSAREHTPDVVLMDISMPVMDGIEATRRLSAQPAAPMVIMLTMSDDDLSMLAAIRSGARGYLLKTATQDDVVNAVRGAALGQAVFGPGAAEAVIALLHAPPRTSERAFPQLTEREYEILELVARGLGNQAVAARLQVSPKTVANTVSGILVKLAVPDRAGAIAAARDAGLGRT